MTDQQFASLIGAVCFYGQGMCLGLGVLIGVQLWRLVLVSKGVKFF